jgi:hypothetical protein
MFDFPALDVAIGLVFVYIVLALICSTINESITTAVGLRARYLQVGLLNLLSGSATATDAGKETVKEFYRHPLVQGLIKPGHGADQSFDPTSVTKWWRKPPYPSYVPSRTFITAVMDLARDAESKVAKVDKEKADAQVKAAHARMEKAEEGVERSLAAIPNAQLSEALLALFRASGKNVAQFQLATEHWFDDSMQRVSGWYKRKVHLILFVIATVVVVLLNADSLSAGRVLWRDDAVRAAVVKKAEAAANGKLDQVEVENAVKQLDLPLGWQVSFGDAPTELPNDALAWLAKLAGLALTIGAILLGAPFWFDLLSKIVRVRGTGAPPPPTTAPVEASPAKR